MAKEDWGSMTIREIMDQFLTSPRGEDIGMVAVHIGVVRGWSRKGFAVEGVEIEVARDNLEKIIDQASRREGIVGVTARVNDGFLPVGEPVMMVAVAGDIRDRVFPALIDTVENIKTTVTTKKEFPAGEKSGGGTPRS